MIKKELMEVISSTEIALDTIELVLKSDYVSEHAVPGQFLYLSVAHHTLRRPISITSVDKEVGTVTLLYKILGDGTRNLAKYSPGMSIDALGPSGQGFDVDELSTDSTALLIGGGIGVPPLYFLANKLHERGINVISILGFQSRASVFYEEKFKQLGETIVVTDDGSYGEKGFVTDVLDDVKPFNMYYTCGPKPMLKAVSNTLVNHKGYISFEERMGCGIGACFACVLETNDEAGYKKICQDGPVFSAEEVVL